jgi:hypothetical protein
LSSHQVPHVLLANAIDATDANNNGRTMVGFIL